MLDVQTVGMILKANTRSNNEYERDYNLRILGSNCPDNNWV